MALQYHPTNHGRKLLLGGSASMHPAPWSSRQAARYYVDSDDDSGIGHSNQGQGERVGSTSSTETEVAQDCSNSQISPVHPQKWWNPCTNPKSKDQQFVQRLSTDPWLTNQRVPPNLTHSLNEEFCPAAMSTPEGSECADDVFRPYKASLVRLPNLENGQHMSKLNWRSKSEHDQLHNDNLAGSNMFQTSNSSNFPGNLRTPCENVQKHRSFKHNYDAHQVERRHLLNGRRVQSFCGDSNTYANVYENVSGASQNASQQMRMISNDGGNRAISIKDQQIRYLNQEALANHYDVPVSRGSQVAWENNRLLGERTASLSSLITIESDLLRVHACPASVIPASEVGDSLSESFYVHHNTMELNRRFSQPPPPPPPPPLMVLASRLRPPSLPISSYESNVHHTLSPPIQSALQISKESGYRDCVTKVSSKPLCPVSAGEVAYATVTKPKHRLKTEKSDIKKCNPSSLPPAAFLDEIEPPLPPRNYRRDLASSKHLTTSKLSLTDKMHDFSRTAKQALRRAFSMEALNCASESSHNDSDEWDNESDWGRVIHPKPRTPASVKARDANRQKLKRSNSTKLATMATLC